MDDRDEQTAASQLLGHCHGEGDRDVQQQDKPSEDEEEDRIAVTVDSVVDAFFALDGSQVDGSVVSSNCGDAFSQAHSDAVEAVECGSGDREEVRTQESVSDTEKDKMEQHTEDGGDGVCAVTGFSSACLQEHDQVQAGKEDGDGNKKVEDGGKDPTFDETGQSPRYVEQKMGSRHQVQQSSNDNGPPASESGDATEKAYHAEHAFQTHDTSSCREEKDGDMDEDGVMNKLDDNEDDEQNGNGANYSDGGKFSKACENSARQQYESEHASVASADFNSRDASLVAQGLVHDVLDRVLRAEAETGESNADGECPESGVKTHYPELEKVDLNSDDWDNDFHARGSSGQDNVSLSSSECNGDSKQHEMDEMLCDSEQTHDPTVDVTDTDCVSNTAGSADTKLFHGETELHGESQSLYQHLMEHGHSADLPPQSQGKATTTTHTVSVEQVCCAEEDNKKSLENRDRQESAFVMSPKPEYPLNYNNYKVCRVLSPGVKECLILETGEQVLYDSHSKCGQTLDTKQLHSPPARYTPTQTERERVKRDLCKLVCAMHASIYNNLFWLVPFLPFVCRA